MSLESEVAALTVATTNLLNSVTTNKTTLDAALDNAAASAVTAAAQIPLAATQVTLATAQVALAAVQSDAAQTQANASAVQAAAAATSAAAASTAKDLAITAWAASTSPAETLAAISQSLHIGAVVKAIVYDTSKDSDGGAWRKRCADKSWYTEALGGSRWLTGGYATISAAWTAAGSTTGAVFQASATAGPLTSGKYYSADSNTTATEVFRGITREFPAQVAIVAETGRVVIYDLTQTGTPMWMVFVGQLTGYQLRTLTVTSLCVLNGSLCAVSSSDGFFQFDFVKDKALWVYAGGSPNTGLMPLGISGRNTAQARLSAQTYNLVNGAGYDVAVTVLDNAPIDPATGLPVPTIAVATAGGVSVIKDDGTVVSEATAFDGSTPAPFMYCAFDSQGTLYFRGSSANLRAFKKAVPYTAAMVTYAAVSVIGYPNIVLAPTAINFVGIGGLIAPKVGSSYQGSTGGATFIKENPATPSKGMVAYITNAYNSGWQVGDSRGAHLADTVAGTITAASLITGDSSDFAGGTVGGWLPSSSAASTASVVSQELQVTATVGYGRQILSVATVVDKAYVLSGSIRAISGGSRAFIGYTNNSTGSSATVAGNNATATAATVSGYFTATQTSTYIVMGDDLNVSGGVMGFDNISVKLAEPDRSVKNKGLVLNGTLTKTAVASGAALVAYSGFSASNYLEQPYNSDLDFGTGDFCVMGWVNMTTVASYSTLAARGRAVAVVGDWALQVLASSGYLQFTYQNVSAAPSTLAIPINAWTLVGYFRTGGKGYLTVNGVIQNVDTSAGATVTDTQATTVIGYAQYTVNPTYGSLALWRISATAPSADQIAHIYRTELPLFQPNAQCCIAGTSTAVTALAYDEDTDLLHVGTSWGRSGFKDLLRIDSDATTTGALTSLSAAGGVVLTGGTSAKIYQPALLLRDEIKRKSEARKALGSVPVFFDYTATASQTAFVVPKGYKVKALYKNGVLMRETTTGVYWTRSNDGFAETCTLSTGATVSDWISIMCVRA